MAACSGPVSIPVSDLLPWWGGGRVASRQCSRVAALGARTTLVICLSLTFPVSLPSIRACEVAPLALLAGPWPLFPRYAVPGALNAPGRLNFTVCTGWGVGKGRDWRCSPATRLCLRPVPQTTWCWLSVIRRGVVLPPGDWLQRRGLSGPFDSCRVGWRVLVYRRRMVAARRRWPALADG